MTTYLNTSKKTIFLILFTVIFLYSGYSFLKINSLKTKLEEATQKISDIQSHIDDLDSKIDDLDSHVSDFDNENCKDVVTDVASITDDVKSSFAELKNAAY